MTTITEDYVSFETAKLLKKKGFDEACWSWYHNGNNTHTGTSRYCNSELEKYDFSKPTLAHVMKWLREVHKIYIDISPTYSETEKTMHFIWQIFDSNYDGVGDCEIFYSKYETACEEAIKYCLENLI